MQTHDEPAPEWTLVLPTRVAVRSMSCPMPPMRKVRRADPAP
ncbi:MAG TPA: hypothetical protein VKG61_00985 [Streptosporangiaceae bacterium]|nr:hypothetical protein [Streptosporangiaceae bacterium]